MSTVDYLKDRIVFFLVNLTLFMILSLIVSLIYRNIVIIFLIFCIWFFPLLSYVAFELIKSQKYYNELNNVLEDLDKKYLLPEVVKEPNFAEGKVLHNILCEVSREMHEHVKHYSDMEKEYREYIEVWVHEIKTPIASTRLIIENNTDPITERIKTQILRIEGFVEQVLYYSRSKEVNNDYIIKSFQLEPIVMKVIKRNSRDFIQKKIKIDVRDIERTIYSDSKWVEFILNQIIGNAIKYSKDSDGKISICSVENNNSILLTIEDNGVGIVDRDVNRVFEKGFTGENGRIFGQSTGIGLYLCKNLCDKLGHGIKLTSKPGEGTVISIIFPQGTFTNF